MEMLSHFIHPTDLPALPHALGNVLAQHASPLLETAAARRHASRHAGLCGQHQQRAVQRARSGALAYSARPETA